MLRQQQQGLQARPARALAALMLVNLYSQYCQKGSVVLHLLPLAMATHLPLVRLWVCGGRPGAGGSLQAGSWHLHQVLGSGCYRSQARSCSAPPHGVAWLAAVCRNLGRGASQPLPAGPFSSGLLPLLTSAQRMHLNSVSTSLQPVGTTAALPVIISAKFFI